MQLIVVRESGNAPGGTGLLRYALSTAPLHDVVLSGLGHFGRGLPSGALIPQVGWGKPEDARWVLPRSWQGSLAAAPGRTAFYGDPSDLEAVAWEKQGPEPWIVITNGRFAAYASPSLLERVLETTRVDCLAVTVTPELMAGREKVRWTPDHKVVGYRRLYTDSLSVLPVPTDWPHYLLVRGDTLDVVLQSDLLARFDVWVGKRRAEGLRLQGIAVAGVAHDLESEEGILAVCQVALRRPSGAGATTGGTGRRREAPPADGGRVSPQARRLGPVLVGREVTIEPGAVVIGPTVLCDGSVVGRDAIVDSSIVGAGVSVEPNRSLRGRVVTADGPHGAVGQAGAPAGRPAGKHVSPHSRVFRTWSRFSYARCFKRIADVVAAALVLILFAPVIPVLALAIKISSPGPVFFRDKRQGLHGRPFCCIKFRTMRPGADKIQDKLRFVSEVDGPQFKMADDPRITTVGRFLRETYLDEIPQFFNVLCGPMSVVGPRPSPESENTLCPSWRDARLSVRPGITGLWQVLRTREPLRDFQEWIHYDTQYVRDFSFGLDLWICWRTFTKMVKNFVRQF